MGLSPLITDPARLAPPLIKKNKKTWHMTLDTWHVTCDTWHTTCDMWHVTHGGGGTFYQNFSSQAKSWLQICQFVELFSVKQQTKQKKLISLSFEFYNMVQFPDDVFTLQVLRFQYRWLPSVFIPTLISSWYFCWKPPLRSILFASKHYISWPIVVNIMTSLLMLTAGSIFDVSKLPVVHIQINILKE